MNTAVRVKRAKEVECVVLVMMSPWKAKATAPVVGDLISVVVVQAETAKILLRFCDHLPSLANLW
jgi:hypothetical protein